MKRVIDRIKGFTLIELMVVIAIIGILATISIVGFGRYQSDTRDARRVSSASAISEALEKYYDLNGEYPGCTVLKTNPMSILKGVDSRALIAPGSNDTNSIKCSSDGNTLTINGTDFFEYQGDGSIDCQTGSSCVQFSIKYKDEGDGQIKTIDSRRQAKITSQGAIALTSNSVSFTSVNLTWTAIQNASAYTLQQATSDDFSNNLVESSPSTPGITITGLNPGSTYYFRVQAHGGTDQTTNWSNTLAVQTLTLGTPTILSIVAANTSLTPSWTTATNATSYRLQYSTSNTFTSPVTVDTSSTSYTTPATLDQGRIYYFRVYALNGANMGNASATSSTNTTIVTPSVPNMANPTNTDYGTYYNTTWTWSAGSTCPANTTMQYQTQWSYNTGSGYTSAWSSATTSTSYTISTSEGYTFTLVVQARCRSNSTQSIVSAWSGSNSRGFFQPVTGPTNISWSASRGSDRIIYLNVSANCRGGAVSFGNFDEYSGSLNWLSGPNSGHTGWYTPGGYRLINVFYPSGGVQNSSAIPNGSYYNARAYIVCRNSETGAQAGGADIQGPGWAWGSSV